MNMCYTRSNNIKNELSTRQSERPPQATGASVASSDARPDTSGDLSVSKHKDERQWRENKKTGVHTPVRIKFSPSVGVPPTGVPRRYCNAGYSAQHHGQDQYNHSHKNTSRENHVFVPK